MKTLSRYLTEGQVKTKTMKLGKFINWYAGETVRKVTPDFIEDTLGWDYLTDQLNISLQEIADLLNNNLKNEFEFTQEDLGNCISIDWTIDGKNFGVDSTNWIGAKPQW